MKPYCNRIFLLGALLIGLPAWLHAALTISANPTSVAFSYTIGSTLPSATSVQIKLTGSTTAIPYTITVPPTAPWLIVTPQTGNTGTSVSVRANPTSLLAGVYTAIVQVDAPLASNSTTFTVTLTVRNPTPKMSITPATASLTWATDQAALSPILISVMTDGEPVSFTAAVTGATWLTLDKSSGIAITGSPVTVTATLATDTLVPATYTAKITFTSSNASNKSIILNVTLTVTPGVAIIDSIWPNAAPIGSNDATVTIWGQHLFKTSVVTAGTTTLPTTWIGTTVMLATIPKALMTAQTTLKLQVTNSPQPASNQVDFTVTPPGPVVQTVVNAASFNPQGTIPDLAPGEIVSIFGSGLGPSAAVAADISGGFFPTTIGSPATLVEFEMTAGVWTPAPIIMVSANQINALIPFALPPGTGTNMRVTYNLLSSTPKQINGVAAEPGLFTTNSSGRGQGAILNYNDTTGALTLNSDSNMALKGSTVVMYLTGGGTITPLPTPDGQIVGAGSPPTIDGVPSVSIGGDGAMVQSATAVPGCIAGLVQLNVTVPSTVSGKGLPVVVTISGRSSPATATISVK